jgi:hypothetical protein
MIEVEGLNPDVQKQIEELRRILEHTLNVDDQILFDTLKINDEFPHFCPPVSSKSRCDFTK